MDQPDSFKNTATFPRSSNNATTPNPGIQKASSISIKERPSVYENPNKNSGIRISGGSDNGTNDTSKSPILTRLSGVDNEKNNYNDHSPRISTTSNYKTN